MICLPIYTYLYRLRPPGPGCQPPGYLECKEVDILKDNRKYWGYVIYSRELTPKEIEDYDLKLACNLNLNL